MRDDATDTALLAATRRGDSEAFGVVYRRHYRLVLAYLVRRVRDPEVGADLTAETFARALVALHDGTKVRSESAAPWLLGIALNTMRDSARRGQAEDRARTRLGMQTVPLSEEDIEWIAEMASDGGLMDLAQQLPPGQRDALMARVIDEQDYPEIARTLQCSEMVVRQRVSRALRLLRDQAEERS